MKTESLLLHLANGIAVTAALDPVDDRQYRSQLTDATGLVVWHDGPWPNRDRALSAACLECERRWGRVVRVDDKGKVDEVERAEQEAATLRDRVAAESREVARRDQMVAVLEKRVSLLEEQLAVRSRTLLDVNQALVDAMDRAEAADGRVAQLHGKLREMHRRAQFAESTVSLAMTEGLRQCNELRDEVDAWREAYPDVDAVALVSDAKVRKAEAAMESERPRLEKLAAELFAAVDGIEEPPGPMYGQLDEPTRTRPTRAERDAQVFQEIEDILASEPVGDYVLPSPNVVTDGARELAERGFVRVNNPRKKAES